MKLTVAYKYVKRIIENAREENACTVGSVRKGLKAFLNALDEQDCLSYESMEILQGIVKRVDDIMNNRVSIDDVFLELYEQECEDDDDEDYIDEKGGIHTEYDDDDEEDEDEDEDEDGYSYHDDDSYSSGDCYSSRSSSSRC